MHTVWFPYFSYRLLPCDMAECALPPLVFCSKHPGGLSANDRSLHWPPLKPTAATAYFWAAFPMHGDRFPQGPAPTAYFWAAFWRMTDSCIAFLSSSFAFLSAARYMRLLSASYCFPYKVISLHSQLQFPVSPIFLVDGSSARNYKFETPPPFTRGFSKSPQSMSSCMTSSEVIGSLRLGWSIWTTLELLHPICVSFESSLWYWRLHYRWLLKQRTRVKYCSVFRNDEIAEHVCSVFWVVQKNGIHVAEQTKLRNSGTSLFRSLVYSTENVNE